MTLPGPRVLRPLCINVVPFYFSRTPEPPNPPPPRNGAPKYIRRRLEVPEKHLLQSTMSAEVVVRTSRLQMASTLERRLTAALYSRISRGPTNDIYPASDLTVVDFTSNDYLALSKSSELKQASLQNFQLTPDILGSGGSRLLNVLLDSIPSARRSLQRKVCLLPRTCATRTCRTIAARLFSCRHSFRGS